MLVRRVLLLLLVDLVILVRLRRFNHRKQLTEIVYTQLSDPAIQEILRNALGSLYDQHPEAVKYCTLIPQTINEIRGCVQVMIGQ